MRSEDQKIFFLVGGAMIFQNTSPVINYKYQLI